MAVHYLDIKEYENNLELAISQLKEELGESIFNSLPEAVKNILIKERRNNLHNEWKQMNSDRFDRNMRLAEENAHRMLKEFGKIKHETIGYSTAYRKFNTMSLGFQEDSLVLEHPELLLDNKIISFPKQTVLNMKKRIKETVDDAESFKEIERPARHYAYFKLHSNGRSIVSTRAIYVNIERFEKSIDLLYEELNNLVEKAKEAADGYEDIFSTDKQSNLTFHFNSYYYPSPKSVINWGMELPEIIKCESFDIFTANEDTEEIECIAQCSNFLQPGLECSSLNELCQYFDNKVCILNPAPHISDIKEVKTYTDLRVSSKSPIKRIPHYLDPSVKYLLEFHGHVGVLTNLRKPKFDITKTSYNPLEIHGKVNKIAVCFDIECYFDPKEEKDQTNIPYLACACFIYNDKIGNILEFEGRDCVSQMINSITKTAKVLKINNIELIAHNGGNYDFHYIISSMYDPSCLNNIMMRNNAFISFDFKHNAINFSVKDSYAFLLCSLSNAAIAFDVEVGKTDFPHHEVRSAEDLQKVFKEWKSIDNIIDSKIEKEKMIVRGEYLINYNENGESKKLIEWAKKYCVNDVIVLANVWIKFRKTTFEIFKINIADQTKTLAGLSFKIFKSFLQPGVELPHPRKNDYINIREALIGGRCISINGIHSNVLCLDVKSLYPAAMAFYDQPYGKMYKVKMRNNEKLGVYYCKIKAHKQENHEFFPIRYNNEVVYKINGVVEYEAWYTSVDIDIGKEEGHEIDIIHGYEWSHKGEIFKDYIEEVLYTYKLQFEQENNKVKRQVIKIIMNSLWGKFAQKWIDTEYSIKPIDAILETDKAYPIWESEYMLIKNHVDKEIGTKPIQNGVFTLSWARYHLKKLWLKGSKPNAKCIYSDTDSLCVKAEEFNLNTDIIGNEMGMLELEHTFNQFVCVGRKQYVGSYLTNGEIRHKKRFKGVPMQYITPELYIHLFENKKAAVEFLKFRREWGSVRGYIESKSIKMT